MMLRLYEKESTQGEVDSNFRIYVRGHGIAFSWLRSVKTGENRGKQGKAKEKPRKSF
jgi:hypothetical protein